MASGPEKQKFDFTVDSWHWAYLIRIEYTNAGGKGGGGLRPQPARVHWCGPTARTRSGIDTTFNPMDDAISLTQSGWSPERVYWEPRAGQAKFDRSLGSLTTHVQPASRLTFSVQVDGKTEKALMEDLLYGRWANHRIQAWLYDMDLRTAILKFDGRLDRNPTNVKMGGFRFSAIQGLPLEDKWPMTRLPLSPYHGGWTESRRCTVSTRSPAPYGGLEDMFHPGEYVSGSGDPGYHLPDWAKGTLVGRIYGGNTATDDGVWREVVFYGHQFDASAADSAFLFFHISPQYNCFIDKAYFTRDDGNVQAVTTGIAVFNNKASKFGPTGTNFSVEIGTAYFDTFYNVAAGETPAKCFARCYGPNTGVPSTSAQPYPEYPQIQVLYGSGTTLVTDTEVLEHVMTEDLDMGPADLVANAFSDFENSVVGVGTPSTTHWRNFTCAVPRKLGTKEAPLVRAVLGDMAWATLWDLTSRLDPVDGRIGLAPVRRKPTPGQTIVDWVIRNGDPQVVDPASWVAMDDPDGVYANQISTNSPTFYLEPLAGSDDELYVETTFAYLHDDTVEQASQNFGAINDRDYTGEQWVPPNQTRAEECYEMHGSALSQPQRVVEIDLGPRYFEMNLGDTIRYKLPAVYREIGQIRSLAEDWDKITVSVASLHILHHESATTIPILETPDDKKKKVAIVTGIVKYGGDPPAQDTVAPEPTSDSVKLISITHDTTFGD